MAQRRRRTQSHRETGELGVTVDRSSNVEVGRRFQELVRRSLSERFGETFDDEVLLKVGDPPKLHRFDLASGSRHVVCECKAYTWTASGNIPSAKISNLKARPN